MTTISLEYRNGTTLKSWRVELDGATQTVTQGKLGAKTPPKPKVKTFKTAAAAQKSVAKAVEKKRRELWFDPSTIAGILEDHRDTLHVHTDAEVAAHRAAYPHAPDAYFEVWRTGALDLGLLSDWGPTDERFDGPFWDLAYLFPVYTATEHEPDLEGGEALDPFFYLCGQLADGSQLVLVNSGKDAGRLSLFEHEPPEELVDHIVPGDPDATFAAWEAEGLWTEGVLDQPYEDFVRERLLHHKAAAVAELVSLREALAAIEEAAEGDPDEVTELSLRGRSLRMLPDTIGAFANLETLDLHHNELSELPPVLRALTRLRELCLYWQAWDFDAAALPDWLAELPLRSLDLGNNDCTTFPDVLTRLSELEVLHLGELDVLPASIGALGALRELVVNGVGRIEPGALGGLGSLETLHLGALQGPLPDDVAELASLESLRFTGGHGRTLNSAVGALQGLRELHSGSTEIPEAIGELASLETWVCPTHGTRLPDAIGELGALRELNLHYARITELPASIGRLSRLEALVAESSYFETLPASFSELKRLKLARLCCAVDVEIGDRLAPLDDLEVLTMNYASLATIPPESWAGLKQLRVIKLYKGHDDPDAVAKFAFLQELPALEEVSPPYQLRATLQAAYPDLPIR